ncbi:MAG: hypothetical protein ABEL76_13775, partial [Bradymonadaceae bacterium]
DAGSAGSAKRRSMTIELTSNQLNLGFDLVDSRGGKIARVDRRGAGADESTTLSLPPGVYYATVTSARGHSCEPYRITVRLSE